MKFEEVLPLMRQGKKAYITKCYMNWWEGKENFFMEYFDSMDHFKNKYPNTKLRIAGEPPTTPFLASYFDHYRKAFETEDIPTGEINELGYEKHKQKIIKNGTQEDYYNDFIKDPSFKIVKSWDNDQVQKVEISFEDEIEYYLIDHKNKGIKGQYHKDPDEMEFGYKFYSDVIVSSEWDVFD